MNNILYVLYTINIVNDFNCKWCKGPNIMVPETVDNFLLDCKGCRNDAIRSLHKNNVLYDGFRNTLKKELKKISAFLKTQVTSLSEYTFSTYLAKKNE